MNRAPHERSEIALSMVDTKKSQSHKKPIISPDLETRAHQMITLKWLYKVALPTEYSFFGYNNAVEDLNLFKENYSYIHLDLTAAYDKISYSRIVGLFRQLKCPNPTKVASWCTYQGSLMRGGITSNYILELILRRLDYRLNGLAKQYRLKYFRYVDDLYFFNTKFSLLPVGIITWIKQSVQREGFNINPDKTEIVER